MTTTKNIKSITIGDTTLPNNSPNLIHKILNGFNKIGLRNETSKNNIPITIDQIRIEP